uniref:Uncharacterized protein n=1 Tax=Timema monikensis TaxID=170555 RepID=A0A7R9EBX3_9NEOP|nr:unnamed protein product [Timema monikensis]
MARAGRSLFLSYSTGVVLEAFSIPCRFRRSSDRGNRRNLEAVESSYTAVVSLRVSARLEASWLITPHPPLTLHSPPTRACYKVWVSSGSYLSGVKLRETGGYGDRKAHHCEASLWGITVLFKTTPDVCTTNKACGPMTRMLTSNCRYRYIFRSHGVRKKLTMVHRQERCVTN